MVVASINVNSLPRHLDDIKLQLKEQGIHILALNETKINQNYSSELRKLRGINLSDMIVTVMEAELVFTADALHSTK